MSENTGFFSKILERRIPQFLGIFLAGSWTALEFTSWAVERYSLSPNWEEVLVVCLLLCLPLILVLAWHHGAPGKQQWRLFEKIFLPLYLLFIPIVLHHLYKDEDLGKTVDTVMMTDESGKTQERTIARSQYLKPIAIFPFENLTNDKQLDSVAVITSEVLHRDLRQNFFFSSIDLTSMETELDTLNVSGNRIPLTLQINTAKDKARDYFVSGTINKKSNVFEITANLYNAKTGKIIEKINAQNDNYFSAIDIVTEGINSALETNNDHYTDLPIEDLYTNNWDSFLNYAQANSIHILGEQKAPADALYKQALELDSTFSHAAIRYAFFLIRFKGIQAAQEYTELAQKHQSYRLTERERFGVNATNYFFSKNLQMAFETLDQWSKLYPNEYGSYSTKAMFSTFSRDFPRAIDNWLKVIELDPSQTNLWDAIGDSYTALGQYDKALNAYEEYRASHPNKPLSYKNLGDLYKQMGKYDSAITSYQQALNIDPNYSNGLRELAKTYARNGDYENAQRNYVKAMEQSGTPAEEVSARVDLSVFYWEYGELKKSSETFRDTMQFFAEKFSPTEAARRNAGQATRYYRAGLKELAKEAIDNAYSIAEEANEEILLINIQASHALLLNEQGKASEALPMYENIFKIAREYLQDGNDLQINYLKSQTHFALGEYDKALVGFKAMNDKFPGQLSVLNWLGKTYIQLNNIELATQFLQQQYKIAPGYPTSNYSMGKLMMATNDNSAAKQYFQKAVDGWRRADTIFNELVDAQNILDSL